MSGLSGAAMNGLRELWAHRMRSLLSMSGIILGVAALAVMLAVGEGMLAGFRAYVSAQGGVERIGVVRAAPPRGFEAMSETTSGLVVRDAEIVRNAVPLAHGVSPEITSGDLPCGRLGKEVTVRVVGCTSDYLGANARAVESGRFVSDIDRITRASVCVIGAGVADALFKPGESPLGRRVRISGMTYTVVGTLDRFESGAASARMGDATRWRNFTVCIPLRTMITRFTGDERITGMVLRVPGPDDVPVAAAQIDNVLMQTHRGLRDFRIETNEATIGEFRKTERGFMWSFVCVTAVALLVGGAGIMNVMLSSIQERTREIGVRLALGARPGDIFLQFVIESTVVGGSGGALGLAGAWAILSGFSRAFVEAMPDAVPPVLSDTVVIAGVGFSCVLGLGAGVYPALRASRLNPIDALRAE